MHAEVRIHAFQPRTLTRTAIPATGRICLDAAEIVFPLIPSSAMHEARLDRARARVLVNNVLADNSPRLLEGYQGPTTLAAWRITNVDAHLITLIVEVPMRSYQTRIDEHRAFEIDWPAEDWSPEIALLLEPQLFVEVNDPAVQSLVERWTNGRPQNAKPYHLAKYLAGRVVEYVQPSEGLYRTAARGPQAGRTTTAFVSGFNVNGAAHAATRGRGSPHDLACLLTAVYRAAGLPARLVIGLDQKKNNQSFPPVVRAWAEFYLLDERTGLGEWIPVDVVRQREFSSRMPPIKQRWEFFGHNEEFDFMVPIAHHWHPPTVVTNVGAPAFWGWLPQPENPLADQELRIWAFETPIRGDDPELPRR